MSLSGASIIVAGGGLAGLTAAWELHKQGARVTLVEPQDRPGGRVQTVRDGFAAGQHAEAGGDMIDEGQHDIQALAAELNLSLTPILKGGWGTARRDASGKVRMAGPSNTDGWARLGKALEPLVTEYRLTESRWDSPIAVAMARRSVSRWLDETHADAELRATAYGLRGFFLADPDALSLIALVDQFAAAAWGDHAYRITGGNDRLVTALATHLVSCIHYRTDLTALSLRGREVRASLKADGRTTQANFDYAVLAMPTTMLRRIPITPALPTQQHEAIVRLKYGRATKTLLQFSSRFWRATGRPRAFGTDLPIGAVWEGNEDQRGRQGILSLMAGGTSSADTATLTAKAGVPSLADSLDWLGGRRDAVIASHQTVWENDPWVRGGYAVFDPGFEANLRPWLARPAGRLFFAGEHTSQRWQGYMNGAVQSGRRAAAEVAATHEMGATPTV